jgi:DNA-directed RNA polymerase specialized sigma24 family protein
MTPTAPDTSPIATVDGTDIGLQIVEHIPALRRYARLLVRTVRQADDLVGDCLEQALADPRINAQGPKLRAWLFSIMHDLAGAQATASAAPAVIHDDADIGRTAKAMVEQMGEAALAAAILQGQVAARSGNHRLVSEWSRIAEAAAAYAALAQDSQRSLNR